MKLIHLVRGGTKRGQQRDIDKAQEMGKLLRRNNE
jgi:hypothetical protein